MNIKALMPVFFHGQGVSHTCFSVCNALQGDTVRVELLVPASKPGLSYPFVRNAIPALLRWPAYRIKPLSKRVLNWQGWRYVRSLQDGDIAYIWPGVPHDVLRAVRRRNVLMVFERVNCHQATGKRILDDAYLRLGWPVTHEVTDARVEEEREELALADYVFAPSPGVAQSLRDAGIPAEKILRGTYGWDPGRFGGTEKALPDAEGVVALFVGRACVRKGAPLLLDLWERAGIRGRLALAGHVYDDVAAHGAETLGRPDVIHFESRDDIAAVYRSADMLVLPTLEEGSPLVIYEAMACGLPVITSPMGAGDVIRDGIEGYVLDPYDQDAWVERLRRLAADLDQRKTMAQAARKRAQEFTWALVGARRRETLRAAVFQ